MPALPNEEKFIALYDDAKHRSLRQEHIYAKSKDHECTFKPKLITQDSRVSQNTIKQVQKEVLTKSKMLVEVAAAGNPRVRQSSQEPKLQRNDKPAVGGVPPQEFMTNSRMTYLSGRETQATNPCPNPKNLTKQ